MKAKELYSEEERKIIESQFLNYFLKTFIIGELIITIKRIKSVKQKKF